MSVRKGGQLIAGSVDPDKYANISLTNSPYTTNRILEIPQDIKLELNNGTLTLKAGSKVYVPNGFEADGTTPKFDVVTIDTDKTTTLSGYTGKFYCSYVKELDNIFCQNLSESGSGTSPTGALYYNTSTNIIDANQGYHYSFPLSENTANGTQLASIDQVFNGFGYIGSTVFVLPGVQVQTPNGKNEDGTYKSGVITSNSVATRTATGGASDKWIIFNGSNVYLNSKTNEVFDADSNYWKHDGTKQTNLGCFGSAYFDGTKISSFIPYNVDSVANSNASNFSAAGKSYLSGLGMPSSRYIDLTLGASGSTYTAPANGWFCIGKQAGANNAYIDMYNSTKRFRKQENIPLSSVYGFCFVPCSKNDVIVVSYNASGTLAYFKFIYAEGEN